MKLKLSKTALNLKRQHHIRQGLTRKKTFLPKFFCTIESENSDSRWTYQEFADSAEFFVPCCWALTFDCSGLQFRPFGIKLFELDYHDVNE